eukprot:7943819-Ditylum_brightwellii.AAC.1
MIHGIPSLPTDSRKSHATIISIEQQDVDPRRLEVVPDVMNLCIWTLTVLLFIMRIFTLVISKHKEWSSKGGIWIVSRI